MFLLDAEILFDLRHARADGEGAALAGWAQRTSRQSPSSPASAEMRLGSSSLTRVPRNAAAR